MPIITIQVGVRVYSNLEEYYDDDGTPTGRIKPNIDTDPDYFPPIPNVDECPIIR